MKEFNSSGELIIQDATITEPGSPVNKAYVDSLVPIGSFAGTGSPEDKVAAPVGSIYVDSAATNGAIRWVKASGTGNTGWRVEYGDTGWRVVANTSTHPTTVVSGEILIRRINSSVEVVVDNASLNNGSLGILIPNGFRPVRRLRPSLFRHISSTPTASTQVTASGYFNFYGDIDQEIAGSIVYTTTNPWPTSLPGTPV